MKEQGPLVGKPAAVLTITFRKNIFVTPRPFPGAESLLPTAGVLSGFLVPDYHRRLSSIELVAPVRPFYCECLLFIGATAGCVSVCPLFKHPRTPR